jgi:hypothetical protein
MPVLNPDHKTGCNTQGSRSHSIPCSNNTIAISIKKRWMKIQMYSIFVSIGPYIKSKHFNIKEFRLFVFSDFVNPIYEKERSTSLCHEYISAW